MKEQKKLLFKVRHVFANRPESAHGGIVFNAPRPIPGHNTWQGDFIHGVFYSSLDWSVDGYFEIAERCHALDAVLVMYHDKDSKISKIREELQNYYDEKMPGAHVDVASYNDSIVISSWIKHVAFKEVILWE